MKLFLFTAYKKFNSKWIADIIMKAKTNKHLVEKIEHLYDLEVSKDKM